MASNRFRRKDLKSPDEFLTTTGRALEYVRENQRQVILLATGLVLLILLVAGVRTYRNWQVEAARSQFNEAYRQLQDGDLEKAAAGFLEAAESGVGSLDEVSLAFAADALADAGRTEEARNAYRRLLESTDDPTLVQQARYNLGVLGDAEPGALARVLASDGPYRPAAAVALAGAGAPDVDAQAVTEAADALPEDLRDYVATRLETGGATMTRADGDEPS